MKASLFWLGALALSVFASPPLVGQQESERRAWLQEALRLENQVPRDLLKRIASPADEEALKAMIRISENMDTRQAVALAYRHFSLFASSAELAEQAVDFLVAEVDGRQEGLARQATAALGGLMPHAKEELYELAQRSEVQSIRAIALKPLLGPLGQGQTRAGLELILDEFEFGRTGTAGQFRDAIAKFELIEFQKSLKKRLRDRKYSDVKKQLILTVLQDPKFAQLVGLAQASLLAEDSRVAGAALTVVQTHGGELKASALKKLNSSKDPALRLQAMVLRARMDWSKPAMQKELQSWLGSRDRVRRQAAARALAIAPSAEAVDQLALLLHDSLRPVQLEAVLSLAAMRRPDALQQLIDAAEHPSPVTADLVQRALHALTSQNFGPSVRTWTLWWADHQVAWEAPSADDLTRRLFVAQQAVEDEENHTGASFWGVPVVSRNVAFVIDMSGSMRTRFAQATKYGATETTRIAAALAQLKQAIGKLPEGTRVALIPFGSRAKPWQDELVTLSPEVRVNAIDWVNGLGILGGTNLYHGLATAFAHEEIDTIYVLSDGEPSEGGIRDPDLLRQEVVRWNETRRIAIHTISIGGPEALMRGLAADSGGVFRKVE